ncbi:hypothetical protein [Leucobacter aridicollis]|uniref:hypothetical protein n=1 Tax=Leucobacter aridicollis TaxID=283878 RepID=UPI002102D579|nr:hypothetical protein [Leucobacter aridicollis]UTX53809.1 hypothetical protein KI794_03495 [Leucobacter aridicollis]
MKPFRHAATERGAHMASRRPTPKGLVRVALAGGVLLGGGALLTWATYSDFANVNLGGGGEGIGSSSKFDIALVDADGTVQQADDDAGIDWPIPNAESFVPGRTISAAVPVFNNSKTYTGELSLVVEAIGDGAVGSAPNITKFIRFSAVDSDSGDVIFGDPEAPQDGVPLAQAAAAVGELAARGADALEQGDAYVAGAAGAERTIEVFLHYVDAAETADYNGGQTALRVRFAAQSK